MILSESEKERAERFFRKRKIHVDDIVSFTFMHRYKVRAHNCKPYWTNLAGPAILVLQFKSGFVLGLQLYPFRLRDTVAVKYLVHKGIPFANYTPPERKMSHLVYARKFCGVSIDKVFTVFAMSLAIAGGVYLLPSHRWAVSAAAMALILTGITMLFNVLLCNYYLTLDQNELILKNSFRIRRFPYDQIRKVNFDVRYDWNYNYSLRIGILDKDYNYYTFPVDYVLRKDIDRIVPLLRMLGIDATNSIDFKFYADHFNRTVLDRHA